MKKTVIVCVAAIVCAAIVFFFPISKTTSFSGNGSVLTGEKDRIEDCTLTIEVKELTSLAMGYKKNFSFAVNGVPCYDSEEVRFPVAVSETEFGDCLISQSYYDAESNRMKPCSLFYWGDHSYAEIFWKDNYYSLAME